MFMFRLPAKLLCMRLIYAVCLFSLLASRGTSIRHLNEAKVSLLSLERAVFYKGNMRLFVVCVSTTLSVKGCLKGMWDYAHQAAT